MSRRKRGLLSRKRSKSTSDSPNRDRSLPPAETPPSASSPPPEPEAQAAPIEATPAPVHATPVPVDAAPEPTSVIRPPVEATYSEEPAIREPTELPKPLAPPAPVELQSGAPLGPWILDTHLGMLQGCQLFRARHKDTDRIRSVVKVLCTESSAGDIRPQLVREGELLFSLRHPNIASVRNLMLTHDPPYVEMDELPGDRLDDLLLRTPLFMAQALDLVEQLLGALVYLHARDVYHRDIHPQNLMLRKDGIVTLMGFAKAIEAPTEPLPAPQCAFGYLPPEWPHLRDPSDGDLYATGCLLYELLTGRAPFDAPITGSPLSMAATLRRKAVLPFLDPGDRFQEDLRAVVRMLTNKEAQGRLPTAATALGRLQRVSRDYAT